MTHLLRSLISIAAAIAIHGSLFAADPTYWQDVRPILRKHCTVCHSERKLNEPELSAGLALDKPELIRKGGKVPVLVVGKPEQSLLVTLLTSKDPKKAMPLDADPLAPEQIAVLKKWVETGAREGAKPMEDDTAVIATTPAAKIRKLPITFATKAIVPGAATPPSAVSLALPIGPLPPVAAVAFSPDGKLLAVGVYGRVTVWDLAAAKPAKVLTNVLGAVNDLKFSPDGKLLAVAGGQPSARGDLRLFDTKDWKLVASLGGHLDVVSGVSFHPKGTQLLSASFDKTVRLWDISKPAAPKVQHTYTGHSDFVYAVAFSPDGTWYATASKDRSGRMIDTKTGQATRTLGGMDNEVLTVAVSPNGEQIVTSGFEPQLHWWEVKAQEIPKKGNGPSTATHEVAFDPKGTLAVAAGADRTVRVIDAQGQKQNESLPHGAVVFAVAIDAAGKRIASGGADGTVKLWGTPGAKPLATLWNGAGEGEFGEWLVIAPEGYYAGSDALLAKGAWTAAAKPANVSALSILRDSAMVSKALAGETVPEIGKPKK